DGRLVAVAQGPRVCLCDAWERRLVRSLEGAALRSPVDLAFSPDGKLLAAGYDELVLLWDVATGKERATLSGHRGAVQAVSFSPDGKRLLSQSEDGTALVWDVAEALRLPAPAAAKKPAPRSGDALWEALAGDAL